MVDKNKYPKADTGDEFLRLDFGDFGELVVKDDGYNDLDVTMYIETPNGQKQSFTQSRLRKYREAVGDVDLEAALKTVADDHELQSEMHASYTTYQVGIFVCDACHRSWPQKKNQTPSRAIDTCPECAEDT